MEMSLKKPYPKLKKLLGEGANNKKEKQKLKFK
jgi:hypothetical protein